MTAARPMFENKFTTGNILSLLGMLITLGAGLLAMNASLVKHDEQIADIRAKIAVTTADHDLLIRIDTKLANVLEQLASRKTSTQP